MTQNNQKITLIYHRNRNIRKNTRKLFTYLSKYFWRRSCFFEVRRIIWLSKKSQKMSCI